MTSTPPPKPRPAVRRRAGAPTLAVGGQALALDSDDYPSLSMVRRFAALALVSAATALVLEPAIVSVGGANGIFMWFPPIATLATYIVAGRLLLAVLLMGLVFRNRHESA